MNKKLMITIYAIMSVIIVALVATVIVQASSTHYVGSNISVVYYSSGIGGKVKATYQVGSNDPVDMVGTNNKTVVEFGSEMPNTIVLLSPSGTIIVPTSNEDVILTYTFINQGKTFYATVEYEDSDSTEPMENISISYKGESDTVYNTKSAVVVVPELETVTYTIKLSVTEGTTDAKMEGIIKWTLTEDKPLVIDTVESAKANVSLVITNNDSSSVSSDTIQIVVDETTNKFKIVGAVPESAVNAIVDNKGYVACSYDSRNAVDDSVKDTMTVAELTNSSGAEFFYFCTNSAVVDNTTYGYIDPGTIYWTSADDIIDVWYDIPTEPLTLYACFMKPNCTSSSFTGTTSGTALYEGTDTQIIISNDVEKIPCMAFYHKTTITDVVMPQSVVIIGSGDENTSYGAFEGCSGLTKIDLPNSVTTLRNDPFASCDNLKQVTMSTCLVSLDGRSYFAGCKSLESLVFPYQPNISWSSTMKQLTFDDPSTNLKKLAEYRGATVIVLRQFVGTYADLGVRVYTWSY